MESVRDLEGFAALVYSSNFEFEAPTSGGGSSGAATTGDASRSDSGKLDEGSGSRGGNSSAVLTGDASRSNGGKVDEGAKMQEVEEVVGGGEVEVSLVQEAVGGFEGVWGKVVAAGSGAGGGDGQGPMTG